MTKPLIVGNWKMNNTVSESLLLVTGIQRHVKDTDIVDVVVAPPFTSLYSVGISLQDSHIKLAAQNLHWEDKGAFTGEISASFLKEIGCEYVIVGHSERRRYFGETDEIVGKKIEAALKNDLTPILCIGETLDERTKGEVNDALERQLKSCLSDLHPKVAENVVIAYEPVWAIGTGNNASPEQIRDAHHFIHNMLSRIFDGPTANAVRIIYGGSVTPENFSDVFKQDFVDGALVGAASLKAESFAKLVSIAARKAK